MDAATKQFYLGQFQEVSAQGKKEIDAFKKENPKQTTSIGEFEGMDQTYYDHMKARNDPIDKKIAETKGTYDRHVAAVTGGARSMDEIAEEVVRRKLWITQGDERETHVKGLTAKLLDFAKGKLDMAGLDKAIQDTLPAGN